MALLHLFTFTFLTFAAPTLISTSVGKVQDHVLTSREVNMYVMVDKALYEKKKGQVIKAWSPQDKEFVREVNGVLLERVVQLEAKSFNAATVEPAEIDQAEKAVKTVLQNNADWKALQVTREELRHLLAIKLQAKKFIRFKADSSVVPITDGEARQYFEENRLKFGTMPFENFRDNIKAFLSRQQVDRRLKDWFDVLQAKYKVRNLLAEF